MKSAASPSSFVAPPTVAAAAFSLALLLSGAPERQPPPQREPEFLPVTVESSSGEKISLEYSPELPRVPEDSDLGRLLNASSSGPRRDAGPRDHSR